MPLSVNKSVLSHVSSDVSITKKQYRQKTTLLSAIIKMITNDQDLINVDYLKTRMSSLLEAFPEPFFNHAMAVKVKSLL